MKDKEEDTIVKKLNIPNEICLADGRKLKRVTWKGVYGSVHVAWEIVK